MRQKDIDILNLKNQIRKDNENNTSNLERTAYSNYNNNFNQESHIDYNHLLMSGDKLYNPSAFIDKIETANFSH
jgi:hypothetical protein